ncbi:cephalosporin-C deacetylase [Paenibacillus marchantiophytorum]|uniref:Cephalosporin-C deacetylase n=1 Tax=Paenibacillus marchantiophytorum TaxID=1619310 RepID=A0ABQ1FFF5_9BACL|nr:acetylxylan esterase [Paenibacillus marchantiophytorum]GGA10776.1 cephalosporin-C deacetylase [Paenibacillus marchantiophytorum]
MNAIQKRIDELLLLNPPLTAREDLDEFWLRTLEEGKARPLNGSRIQQPSPLRYVNSYRVTYEGYDDTLIHGWFLVPTFATGKLPCVIIYPGYSGGSGSPEDYGQWLLMGIAVFAVDVRGQGGDTGNHLPQTSGMTKGWITQGILDKETCYYKAIAVDSLKAVDWVYEQPEIDTAKIGLVGGSQGGGLVLLTAALSDKASLTLANVPNMCHLDHGALNSTGSLTEVAQYIEHNPDKLDQVLATLSYFDMLNLAERIRTPILMSVGLKDTICLPETIYPVYKRIPSEKYIHAYPFTGHMVTSHHNRLMLDFVAKKWALEGNVKDGE